MKTGVYGCALLEGTHKYNDPRMAALVEKFSPKKVTPWYMEFHPGQATNVEGILATEAALLDVLIPDIEFCEARKERSDDPAEQTVMEKCLDALEEEVPLSRVTFTDEELAVLQGMSLQSRLPVAVVEEEPECDAAMELMLEATGTIFFYTAGPKEVRAWSVKEGADAVTCAGAIHSDLARGFIRADAVQCADLLTCHNFAEAKAQGMARQLGKTDTVRAGDVIEVHFSV